MVDVVDFRYGCGCMYVVSLDRWNLVRRKLGLVSSCTVRICLEGFS